MIDRLNAAIRAIVNQDDTKAFYAKLGAELGASTPEQLAATLRQESDKWSKIVKDIGLEVNYGRSFSGAARRARPGMTGERFKRSAVGGRRAR